MIPDLHNLHRLAPLNPPSHGVCLVVWRSAVQEYCVCLWWCLYCLSLPAKCADDLL